MEENFFKANIMIISGASKKENLSHHIKECIANYVNQLMVEYPEIMPTRGSEIFEDDHLISAQKILVGLNTPSEKQPIEEFISIWNSLKKDRVIANRVDKKNPKKITLMTLDFLVQESIEGYKNIYLQETHLSSEHNLENSFDHILSVIHLLETFLSKDDLPKTNTGLLNPFKKMIEKCDTILIDSKLDPQKKFQALKSCWCSFKEKNRFLKINHELVQIAKEINMIEKKLGSSKALLIAHRVKPIKVNLIFSNEDPSLKFSNDFFKKLRTTFDEGHYELKRPVARKGKAEKIHIKRRIDNQILCSIQKELNGALFQIQSDNLTQLKVLIKSLHLFSSQNSQTLTSCTLTVNALSQAVNICQEALKAGLNVTTVNVNKPNSHQSETISDSKLAKIKEQASLRVRHEKEADTDKIHQI